MCSGKFDFEPNNFDRWGTRVLIFFSSLQLNLISDTYVKFSVKIKILFFEEEAS